MKAIFASLTLAMAAISAQADTSIYEAQKALNALGYDVGAADGSFGPRSREGF